MIASYDPFTYHDADGYVHSGIYHSAKALSEGYLKLAVIEALEKNQDYDLVITGHSLGGGCAALLTLIWSKRIVEEDGTVKFITNTDLGFPSRIINAFVYACPAIMSSQLSQYVCGLITTVIYRNDIVPRLSLGLIRDFRNVTISLCNEQGLAEGVIGKVLGIFREYQAEVADDPKDDLWYWALLKTLRADMRAEKLYPPGTVYWINAADGLDPNPVPPSMTELLISLVEDVEDAFSEIYFSTSMFTDQYFNLT